MILANESFVAHIC